MLPLSQALEQMLNQLPSPTGMETLPIHQASQRICAENVVSPINVPSFDNSAMDGYAVRLADLQQSMTLSVAGKAFAGAPFEGEWTAQSAVRIMTGAMIPQGADAVVMQEDVQVNDDGSVTFTSLPKLGQNIRRIGEDVKLGDVVLQQGALLNAVSLPLLASLGIENVTVFPRLKVAVLSTGDELVPVGQLLQVGVGEADFTKHILEKVGKINFWKIAIKPGKPFAFGKLEKAWFCGLPGNPVSALVTFYQLVQPAIAKLSGYSQWKAPMRLPAIAATNLKKAPGRLDFQRGFYQLNAQGQIEVQPVGFQGSHLFSSFVKSNCFIVLEQERGNVIAGETVTIEPFNDLLR